MLVNLFKSFFFAAWKIPSNLLGDLETQELGECGVSINNYLNDRF